jgi:UDP-galactopyranose mutase
MKRALVIGTGIGAATVVIELAKRSDWQIDMVDVGNKLGGGLATRWIGGHPCTLGPRHFLTHDEKIFDYLNSLIPMRRCGEHQFISYVESDNQFYNYPIHEDDIPSMPDADRIHDEIARLEEGFKSQKYSLTTGASGVVETAGNYRDFWLRSIGPSLYAKFIESYTRKMWLLDDEREIDDFTWSPKGVALKRGSRASWDTAISAYPLELSGYDPIFLRASSIANTKLGIGDITIEPGSLNAVIDGTPRQYDAIFSTAPVDSAFANIFGRLHFIGRQLDYIVLPVEFALPRDVYFCYYTGGEPYTRVTEYKKFTRYESPQTLISIEKVDAAKGRYYPMPTKNAQALFTRYTSLFHDRFFPIGRLARFHYRYDIDDSIAQAIEAVKMVV